MTNNSKQLSQWLLDFATMNDGGFAPEQIQKLNEAANAIITLDTVVDDLIKERDDAYAQIDALNQN